MIHREKKSGTSPVIINIYYKNQILTKWTIEKLNSEWELVHQIHFVLNNVEVDLLSLINLLVHAMFEVIHISKYWSILLFLKKSNKNLFTVAVESLLFCTLYDSISYSRNPSVMANLDQFFREAWLAICLNWLSLIISLLPKSLVLRRFVEDAWSDGNRLASSSI